MFRLVFNRATRITPRSSLSGGTREWEEEKSIVISLTNRVRFSPCNLWSECRMGECMTLTVTQRCRHRRHLSGKRGKGNAVRDGQLYQCPNECGDADEYHRGLLDDTTFMGVEELRLQTFPNWSPYAPVTAQDLARDGFFYLGPEDRVQCAFCRRVLYNWKPGDNVREEHRKINPRCPFLRGRVTNAPPQNITRPPIRGASQTGYQQTAAWQPAAPVSQGRQAMQPSEEATSTSGVQPSGESSGAVGGDVYTYITTAEKSGGGLGGSSLPPNASMALLKGPSSLTLPPDASLSFGTGSVSKAASQPASVDEPGQAGKSKVTLPEELPKEQSSFPGARYAAATASSAGTRRVSSSESHAELASFPGARHCPVAPKELASVPVRTPGTQVSHGSSSSTSHLGSDESSCLDAEVELFLSSPAVEAVKSMGFEVSDDDLRALVLRLLLEQGRGFKSSELAAVLMEMESSKLTVDQVSLPVTEDSGKLSVLSGSRPAQQALPSAPLGSVLAQSTITASTSASASQALLGRSLSSQSGGDPEEVLTCKICMDRQVQVTFDPCGHLVCCEICGHQISECPLCRHPIKRRVRTYLS